ncbi:hypothetical protein BDW74DRAFT_146146 [Aspergillus multicolor]|uniref:putative pyruvate dehydrogenase E1 component alpha subunit n=1 Tax=Aspergillus multicolor TaxID=41759 RepID=UPI003CCE2560
MCYVWLKRNCWRSCSIMSALRHAKEYVQAGKGPLLYAYATYRYVGHSMSDPGTAYRSRHGPESRFREN